VTDEPETLPQSPAALPSVVPESALAGGAEVIELDPSVLGQGLVTRTCPQCGRNAAPGEPAFVELTYLPPGVFAAAGFSMWIGAIVWHFSRKTFHARISVCDECFEAHRRGVMWRRAGLVGFTLAPGPLTVLLPLLSPHLPWTAMLWSVLSVVGGVGCIAAFQRTKDTVMRLAGPPNLDSVKLVASSSFSNVLMREQPQALAGVTRRPQD
jgi:hypothetical protein